MVKMKIPDELTKEKLEDVLELLNEMIEYLMPIVMLSLSVQSKDEIKPITIAIVLTAFMAVIEALVDLRKRREEYYTLPL